MLDRGESGMFFPLSMGFSYVPENGAAIYCGATTDELAKMGGKMFEPTAAGAMGEGRVDPAKIRQTHEIPNSIDDLTDDWVGVPIFDSVAKRTFAFLKPELEHYRALRIAPPTTHFV